MCFMISVSVTLSSAVCIDRRDTERDRERERATVLNRAALNTSNGWRGRGWKRGGEMKKDGR